MYRPMVIFKKFRREEVRGGGEGAQIKEVSLLCDIENVDYLLSFCSISFL